MNSIFLSPAPYLQNNLADAPNRRLYIIFLRMKIRSSRLSLAHMHAHTERRRSYFRSAMSCSFLRASSRSLRCTPLFCVSAVWTRKIRRWQARSLSLSHSLERYDIFKPTRPREGELHKQGEEGGSEIERDDFCIPRPLCREKERERGVTRRSLARSLSFI